MESATLARVGNDNRCTEVLDKITKNTYVDMQLALDEMPI
jgi:hypothetical protein